MTKPTDAEILALLAEKKPTPSLVFLAKDDAKLADLQAAAGAIAREVLAKWGTQPVACEPLTCEWAHNEDDGFWDTECGQSWRFDYGGPKENHMNFCHCCGKPLRIKGGQHGTE